MPFPSVRACGLNLFEGASSHAGIYSYCYALCAATLSPPDQVSAPHCAVVIAQLGHVSRVKFALTASRSCYPQRVSLEIAVRVRAEKKCSC